jgi:hypothetical protein
MHSTLLPARGSSMNYIHRIYSSLAQFDRLNPPALPFIFLLATAALFVRMPDLLLTPSLWAEDLTIYVSDAVNLGLASVPRPHAGYHQLFSRLVAFMTIQLVPFKYTELFFHLVALAVVYFLFLVTWLCLPLKSFSLRMIACLAIVWVPINPDFIFLALLNTQWLLGVATALLIVSNYVPRSRYKALWYAPLAVLCLTGPFAVLCLPVVVFRMLFYRDVKQQKFFYLSILLPTAIQCASVVALAGSRGYPITSQSITEWYTGVVRNTVFQFIPNLPVRVLFGAFLVGIFWTLIRGRDRETRFTALCLLAVALINIAAGFYSYRYMPAAVGPFFTGERYFLIPFLLFIFFILSAARGALQPIAIFFVAFACLANARPFHAGPEGRGAGFWASQIELSRYLHTMRALEHPVWADETWRYDIDNAAPQNPPVLVHLNDLSDVELVGLSGTLRRPGEWAVTADTSVHDAGKNLLTGSAGVANMTVSDLGNNTFEATVSTPNNTWFQAVPGVQAGATLTFSFEARSDQRLTIQPHLTDGIAGQNFAVVVDPDWKKFVFELRIAPRATSGGVFVVLNSVAPGKFFVRNLKATLDPSRDRYIRIPIPDRCKSLGNLALTYMASSAQTGFHMLDRLVNETDVNAWNAQYRWVGVEEKHVIFAVPNNRSRWLKLTVNPSTDIREMVLRCY